MSPEMLKLASLVVTFVTISGGMYVFLSARAQRTSIRTGLDEATVTGSVADIRASELDASAADRLFKPGARRLAGVVYRFGPKGLREKTRERLVLAGLSEKLDVDTFFAVSLALPVLVAAGVLTYRALGYTVPMLGWLLIVGSAFFPKMWLTNKVESRQHKILLALPDTLDLLTIAVEAGLGFDAALARVVGSIKGPLSDELYRMLQELRIGIPRSQALNNLSERTRVAELDQFITAMSQAESFGISVGKVLRVQAHQLRQRRSQIAEEKAAKTPVKLLFPLLLCIFPALFVVLVGPAGISISQNLFGAGGI